MWGEKITQALIAQQERVEVAKPRQVLCYLEQQLVWKRRSVVGGGGTTSKLFRLGVDADRVAMFCR